MTNQIVIVGFMGTGKSTVARVLARRLNCLMIDLDERITRNNGRSPKEIIEQDGEGKFREIETQLLREVLSEDAAQVVAVGGGAWTVAENRKLIADHGAFTVWLDAPFELCWRRIEGGREARPLARSREAAESLHRERLPSYALADSRILVAESDRAEEIVTKILNELARQSAVTRKNRS